MFTTDVPTCTSGAVSALVVGASGSAVVITTPVNGTSWYRPIDGSGFSMNHKRLTRRPPIPTS